MSDAVSEAPLPGQMPMFAEAPSPAVPDYVVERGQVWQLGAHRLMCGDATSAADLAILMCGNDVHLVFGSPPYGKRRAYSQMLVDWRELMRGMSQNLPVDADAQVLINLGIHHADGEWSMQWLDWIADMGSLGYKRAAWLVWDKGDGMPIQPNQCRPNPAHEFLFLFRKQKRLLQKSVACKWHGRDTMRKPGFKNVLGKPGAIDAHVGKPIQPFKVLDSVIRLPPEKANRTAHPAVFPVALPTHVYMAFTAQGDAVYDPFCGSGTSILAAEQTGRIGYGMEIAPEYVAIALARWAKAYPNLEPKLVERA